MSMGWMDGWMDGWIDGWMDGWMDGYSQRLLLYQGEILITHILFHLATEQSETRD